jgi:D-alanyl-D-alanine-carboxypeptidase/D-alanyl-D-alanine-endopeptidase
MKTAYVSYLRILALVLLIPAATVQGQQSTPSSTTYQENLANQIFPELIDEKKEIGIVVGLMIGNQRKILTYGKPGNRGSQRLDGDSVFEIGSITKPFTGILLAEMVERGEVNFSDPIRFYLPNTVNTPKYQEQEITLLDLATQSSGLPGLPTNFAPKDKANPYADYTVAQLYEFLSSYKLEREVGSVYQYSNLGFGLLAHLLSLKAGTDYENLIMSRVCMPLQLNDTRITLTKEMQARLVAGHDKEGNSVQNWDFQTLVGHGALRSTANDMLKFLAANMGQPSSTLLPAMMSSHLPRRRSSSFPLSFVGLGWQVRNREGKEIIWHNGGTGGYSAFVGFSKKQNVGVVVLSNTAIPDKVTGAGMSMLVSLMYRLEKK